MKNKQRAGILIPMIVLVVCVASVVLINRLFTREEIIKEEFVGEQRDLFAKGYIEVIPDVIRVDPISSRLTLELSFVPHGRFDAGEGVLAVPLEIDVSDVNGAPISFAANRRMSPHEASIDMHEGEVEDYPFDKNRALLEVLVLEKNGQDEWVAAPAQLDFAGDHHGFVFKDKPIPANSADYLGYDLRLTRSPLVIWTAIFCMAVMWGLTIVNLFMLLAVLRGQMQVDMGLFGYMSGFLVAMYFFRQILPDTPPFIGVRADYLAFFWVELIAAGISIIFAVVWLRRMILDEAYT